MKFRRFSFTTIGYTQVIHWTFISLLAVFAPFAQGQHGTVSTAGTGTAGVQIESDAAYPDVVVKTGNTTTSAFRIFNAANVELFRTTASGNVGIGAATPWARLTVDNGTNGVAAFVAQQRSAYLTNTTANDAAGSSVAYTYVGAGATNSGGASGHGGLAHLYGAGTLASAYGLIGEASVLPGQSGSITTAYGVFARVKKNDGAVGTGFGLYVDDVTAANDIAIYQVGQDDSNYFAGDVTVGATGFQGTRLVVNGKVGIGTVAPTEMLDVQGNINVSGNINAKYQDVAEWVSASSDLQPGTVVVLNSTRDNEVMASTRAYDTSVAGVVSARPGLTLGESAATKETVATMGRVRVRVDARRAPIAVGDLLVTSDRPGYAMKSIPVRVDGVSMHRPGTILGKALQPLAAGEGEILVLLSMQ